MDFKLDPYVWFYNRELEFKPKHFIVVNTPLSLESRKWIINNLRGRYAVVAREFDDIDSATSYLYEFLNEYPAFEDPKDAMLFELRWA